jgi:hypothetical protein
MVDLLWPGAELRIDVDGLLVRARRRLGGYRPCGEFRRSPSATLVLHPSRSWLSRGFVVVEARDPVAYVWLRRRDEALRVAAAQGFTVSARPRPFRRRHGGPFSLS